MTVPMTLILCVNLLSNQLVAQHSVARKWNEVLLTSIRNDFARPPVHARNLFHVSAAMYDAWSAYDELATPWLLGKTYRGFHCPFDGVTTPSDVEAAREEAISYAAYRIILHRFANSPGKTEIVAAANQLMSELGYDVNQTSVDYTDGLPSSLGNYIGASFIEFGFQDGSNELDFYRNQFYSPVNPPLIIKDPGNPFMIDPNRWQPLFLETFIDQSGNVVPSGAANFLSPEWGSVIPFALNSSVRTIYERDGNQYWVYHDPGPPPYLQTDGGGLSSEYKWGFSMVAKWASHLDHSDDVIWDISPASIGNIQLDQYPTTVEGLRDFYDADHGGDPGSGHALNPKTGQPYAPQLVPRGDYTRVLAEFWADGPASETPPGHWFTILNYVSDHPQFERKFKGEGESIDPLEWDVKAYFTLGGAMHDVAITCWGIKGWYDYTRPVSAIRYMADKGQSTDPGLANYSPEGIPLSEGFIELVQADDPLAGEDGENIGKIKVYSWRGPNYINDPAVDHAGVGWILAEDWWPYQRPTFVTPPFAGYTSGHSTYSRAAAEVLTYLSGDKFFPGGLGEFPAPQNAFLVFEEGPSVDLTLQWATYQDAADQCSLSRIWGSIHPPQDDISGRLIGRKIGINASEYAEKYFLGIITGLDENFDPANFMVYPNPIEAGQFAYIMDHGISTEGYITIANFSGQTVYTIKPEGKDRIAIPTESLVPGLYLVKKPTSKGIRICKLIVR